MGVGVDEDVDEGGKRNVSDSNDKMDLTVCLHPYLNLDCCCISHGDNSWPVVIRNW